MTAVRMPLRAADFALASRDDRLPCLAVVLDDVLLSEVLGESVQVTRVRYKPGISALVAFRRTLDGNEAHAWALTTARNVKLDRRSRRSERRGGGLRLVDAAVPYTDAVIAVGGIEDDWALAKNLRWLASRGLEELGAVPRPARRLLGNGATVLRYKPERRVVLLEEHQDAPIVIKTAAHPAAANADRLHQRLRHHGVPVLPLLGGADCRAHGTSASPLWGDRDLAASDRQDIARRAGEALARLHSIPAEDAAGSDALVERQLAVTCAMIAALVPALELRAARVADRIRRGLEDADGGRSPAVVHGDFSADQVLVSGSAVRLIDFDRARAGVPEADLGSFAAVEEMRHWRGTTPGPPRSAALMEGYLAAGGRFIPEAADAWAALRLFACSVDPFRDRCPDWAADLSRHLDRASELAP